VRNLQSLSSLLLSILAAAHSSHPTPRVPVLLLYSLFSGFEEELLGSYAFDILRALAHLHDAGVTHRNISSANVLLDPQVPLHRCTNCSALPASNRVSCVSCRAA